jgi:hypothetical protein
MMGVQDNLIIRAMVDRNIYEGEDSEADGAQSPRRTKKIIDQ